MRLRTFDRVGAVVSALRRRHPWTWPLRWWWGALDYALTLWWRFGLEDVGAARFAGYRALEDRWQRAYDGVYWPLVRFIAREIGE